MGNVGLLYVGAVLFINGLMLLGVIPGKSAAVLNIFVGGMQVIFPTIIILQADGDAGVIFGAAGLYLFGFTYLYVAANQIFDLPGEGLGWFSLFVAVCAVYIGMINFLRLDDPVFGSIWMIWAVLWLLFFLLLGLGRSELTVATGWFTVIVAHLTGTVPALLSLSGDFSTSAAGGWWMAAGGVVALVISFALGNRARTGPTTSPEAPSPEGSAVPAS